MLLERFLFPAPSPPHYTLTSHKDHLIWLPAEQNSTQTMPIPCMFYSPSCAANYFIIWCHGNGCDIGSMDMTLTALSRRLYAHVLVFEYPSYGLLNGITPLPSKESINNHGERAYSFVRHTLKWPADRIIIYGHSIGSGVACHLASTQQVGALILQSPYTSISTLVGEKLGIFSNMIHSSFWDNDETMKIITCPILFIHGQLDNLIPSQHSQILFDSLSLNKNKQLVLLPDDDHNSISDPIILIHVEPFLKKYFQVPTEPMHNIEIDPTLHVPPPIHPSPSGTNWLWSLFGASGNAATSVLNSFGFKRTDK